jgi:ribosomal-protein-alanine N-acetyltransferase
MPDIMTTRLALLPYVYPDKEMLRTHTFWMNDKDVVRYSQHRHIRYHHNTLKKYIGSFDHQRNHLWAILDKNVKRHPAEPWVDHYLGHITAHCDPFNRTAQVGIMIGERRYWGRGYGQETWSAVCDWLIENGARKVCAGCMEPNVAMCKIFTKAGMVEEARLKDQFMFEGKLVDEIRVAKFA